MNTPPSPWPNVYTRSFKNLLRRAEMRVGLVLGGPILPYGWATAVARLRMYDVMEMFAHDRSVAVELYLPGRQYDAVVFEKTFTPGALALAQRLKEQGAKIILDVNVDYFSLETPRVTPVLRQRACAFAGLSQAVIVPSLRLRDDLLARHVHSRIEYIPEPLPDRYFEVHKNSFSAVPKLVWCGYHEKAGELMTIAEPLQRIRDRFGVELIVVSDREPRLALGSYRFVRYRERTVARELAQADVFVAPRQFNQAYKYHHTFTKIGLPMAVGLPVIASPIPSYLNSPALICFATTDWHDMLARVYSGDVNLSEVSKRGREYCQREYSWERIRQYYRDLFYSVTGVSS